VDGTRFGGVVRIARPQCSECRLIAVDCRNFVTLCGKVKAVSARTAGDVKHASSGPNQMRPP